MVGFNFNNNIVPSTSTRDRKIIDISWNRETVAAAVKHIEDGYMPTRDMPFFFGDPTKRDGEVRYDYTTEEQDEWLLCAENIVYFASKYCYAMTDEGIQKITLRDYQIEILQQYQDNRFNILLCGRQMGKTITSAIFLAWYACFNYDKNIIIVANKGETSSEILDKLKTVMFNLPFFLQPGIKAETKTNISLGNGVKIKAKTTTKNTGIGSVCHLLFADEFAHVEDNISEQFYKSIFPTLSSSAISRMIVTSTPNGFNKFWELWESAQTRRNSFNPIFIDWYRAPGRDENWRLEMIENLGGEHIFDQEYACKFVVQSNLLLSESALNLLNKIKINYKYEEIEILDNSDLDFSNLKFHPNFDLENLSDPDKRFVVTLDPADGVGKDYSSMHIFMYDMLSSLQIKNKKIYTNEYDFFCMKQIGTFRSNNQPIEEVAKLLETIVFNLIGFDRCHVSYEHNFKGDYIYNRLLQHPDFFTDIFLHTKHNVDSINKKAGVSLKHGNRTEFIQKLKRLIQDKRIQPNEIVTINEFNKFSKSNNNNRYEGVGSNDDTVMSTLMLVPYMESDYYQEFVDSIIDVQDPAKIRIMQNKLFNSVEARGERNTLDSMYEVIGKYL